MNNNLYALALCLGLILGLGQTPASAGEVIVNGTMSLTPDEVKEVFLGDKQLAGNLKIVPVDNAAQQGDFLSKVLGTDMSKYAARWTKKAFREGLNAPAVKGNDAEVTSFVKSTPGAIGYVAGPSSGVKVLQKY